MAFKDIIPWRKGKEDDLTVDVGREENALLDIRDQMNRMFDEFFERPFGIKPFFSDTSFMSDFAPQLDVVETDRQVTVSAELPGLEPEDIHISLDHNNLTISGEKRAEKEDKGKRYYRVERSYGSFYRSIRLPDEVDEDKIDATYKRGVLKIKLPKTKQAQEKRKHIPIKTG